MFASIRIKEMLARVSPSFDSNFASRLRRLVGVFTHRRFVSLFTQSERSPLPTQKLKKKITQSVSFVAASVIALNAAPALAVSPIEIQDKRTENAGGLQLIYEVRLSSFARYRTAVVYECFRFVFPSFTKARSALFFVGRRRRKGMISRIKKSFFLIRLFASKKKES